MSYKLIYTKNGKLGFNTEKDEYEPGETVRVKYIGMGTDEIYTFTVNADDVKTVRNDFVAEITFTMPEHDVELNCTGKSMWSPSPSPVLGMGQFTGMNINEEHKQSEPVATAPSISKGWTCPNCSTFNAGRFCGGCGTPRPPEMQEGYVLK